MPTTTHALIELLQQYPPDTPIQFAAHDGPDYGWLEVGGTWAGGYLEGATQIGNES